MKNKLISVILSFAVIISAFVITPVKVSNAQIPGDYYYELITDMDTRVAFAAYKSLLNGPYLYVEGGDDARMEKLSIRQLQAYEAQGVVKSFELTNKSLTDDDLPTLVSTAFEALEYDDPMNILPQALGNRADATIRNGIMYVGYINPPDMDFADMQEQANKAKSYIVETIKKDKKYKDDPLVQELLVHDYLCEHMKYDGRAAAGDGDRVYIGHTVYGAMVEGNAVCDAISMSCAAILRDFGIDCYIVSGGSHAWNMVYMDGEYYDLDCTWDMAQFGDEGKTTHEYFNKKTDYMTSTEHTRELLSLKLPVAEGETLTFEKALERAGIAFGERIINGIKYNINESMEAHITGLVGSKTKVTLPPQLTIDSLDYPVVMIDDEAFKDSKLQKVTIGDGINMIGDRAFAGCKKLKTVIIKNAEALQYILEDAFKGTAKKITFKISGSKKEFNNTKSALIACGVKKGIFKRVK